MNVTIKFSNHKLSEVIDEFLLAKQIERYSPNTIDTYRTVLGMFRDFVGPVRFANLDASDIRHWLASLDVAGKTLCNYWIALSSLWSWAIENEYCKDHIVKKVGKPRYNVKSVKPFEETDVHRILAACKDVRERLIVLILLDSGIRASELASLTVDDWLDLALQIRHGKGDKERIVPISRITERHIYHHLRHRVIRDEGVDSGASLIQSWYFTKPLTYDAIRHFMKRLEKRTGVDNIHAHRFRHTFAITFLRNGGDIYTLQKILGHSTLEMVKHYLDIAITDIERTHAKASPITVWRITG